MMFDLDSTTLSCHATMTESLRRTRRACDSRGGYTYTRPRGGREVRTQISARVLFCLSDSAWFGLHAAPLWEDLSGKFRHINLSSIEGLLRRLRPGSPLKIRMLPSEEHAPEGDEGVCRTDTSRSVISAESFESAKGAEGAEGAKGPIGLEDLTAAEFESVYVVQAAAENDAHVTGAIEEPPSGIVISYMLHDEIRESELLDVKNLKEVDEVTKTIDEEVADEHVQAITLEEVEQVDKQVIEDKLDKMIELYDNKDLMEAMLEQSLAPEGDRH